MNLQQIKNDFGRAGFFSDSVNIIDEIINKAINCGELEKEEINQICQIIDVEVKTARVIADARREIAKALNDYADGLEEVVAQAAKEMEDAGKTYLSGNAG